MPVRDETDRPNEFGSSFQPRGERELSETMKGCSREGRPVRLSGGGLVAKSPSAQALGVWMFGVTGVSEIRADDLVAKARAGTAIADLDEELREKGRRFPLRPHDVGARATLGGVFAAGADGLTARLGFRARDVLLGARAVLASGDVVFVGAEVVKSVAGFDVCKAFVGSRGTLGALTETTFRIEAIPDASVTFSATFAGRVETHAAVAAADALPLAASGSVVSPSDEAHRVDVLLEGPRAAVVEAGRRLAKVGFKEDAGDWATLTAFAATEPKTLRRRVVRPAARATPLDSLPAGCESYVIDVLRGRCYAHVPPKDEPPPPVFDILKDRVRRAFDPHGVFEPGRGWGAP
jgi:glycolate oxidase FAD binding subunit